MNAQVDEEKEQNQIRKVQSTAWEDAAGKGGGESEETGPTVITTAAKTICGGATAVTAPPAGSWNWVKASGREETLQHGVPLLERSKASAAVRAALAGIIIGQCAPQLCCAESIPFQQVDRAAAVAGAARSAASRTNPTNLRTRYMEYSELMLAA